MPGIVTVRVCVTGECRGITFNNIYLKGYVYTYITVYVCIYYLMHESVYNIERYFTSTCDYFHELKASENTSVRVKCHPHIVRRV